MFKKFFALFLGFLFVCQSYAIDLNYTASQMQESYESGFYPGAIRYADEILSSDVNSMYALKAFVLKGECLYRINRVEESLECLKNGEKLAKDNKELLGSLNYWQGRCYFAKENFTTANEKFFVSAQNSKKYYDYSILYAAFSYYRSKQFNEALPLYKYVIANGKKYAQKDYEQSAIELIDCYNKLSRFDEGIQTACAFESANFSSYAQNMIMLEKGDCLVGAKKYKEGYLSYCKVLQDGPGELAALSMQKAYYVSSEHKNQVGEEPGQIIDKAQDRLSLYPSLLNEFWTRLAIDAYYAGDYNKSLDYFTKVSLSTSPNELMLLSVLYRSQIVLKTSNGSLSERAQKAEKVLNSVSVVEKEELLYYFDLQYARLKALQGDWSGCKNYSLSAKNSVMAQVRNQVDYWYILSDYEQGDYKAAYENVKNVESEDKDFLVLKAQILARNGNSSAADKIFYDLEQKSLLNNDGILDYTRTLLNAGYLISATEQSVKAKGSQADYMAGLALFNREKWSESSAKFAKCVNDSSLEKKYRGYARFYLAYCQYRTEEFAKSANNFSAFVNENLDHSLIWNGCELGAKSAVQAGNYDAAFKLAQKSIQVAKNEKQKQDSLLLCSGIYADSARYDEAIKTLDPYANKNDAFGIECRFKIAQLQMQKKDYASSEKSYLSIAQEKTKNDFADEALYRYAEISYVQAQNNAEQNKLDIAKSFYEQAAKRFDNYCSKKMGGQFAIQAQYFASDCYLKLGDVQKAKLYYESLLENSNIGTYSYGCQKQLIDIYKTNGEYEKATALAQKMLKDYGQQARDDGIVQTLDELYVLNKGGNAALNSQEAQFAKLKGEKTSEGRRLGTELAQNYFNAGSQTEAEKTALKVLNENKKNIKTESEMAATNATLLAKIYRNKTENKKSAQMYLDAATWFRNCGREDDAAKSLYGAAESFDAATLYGDSKAVIENMQKLYPQSSWTKEALKLDRN